MAKGLIKVELGKKYRDIVLDITGICVSYSQFLTGCDRCNLQYKDKDGDVKSHHIDVTCCELVVDFDQIVIPTQKMADGTERTGGPQESSMKPEIGR